MILRKIALIMGLVALCSGTFITSSNALTLRIKDRSPMEGKLVEVEGNKVTFESNGMRLTFMKDRLESPEDEWYTAAQAAFDKGDLPKSYDICRQLLIWNPENVKAKELFQQTTTKMKDEKKTADNAKIEKERLEAEQEAQKKFDEKRKELEATRLAAQAEELKHKPYEILKKISAFYSGIKTIYFEQTETNDITAPGMKNTTEIPTIIAMERPNKFYASLKSSIMDFKMVSDGKYTWIYTSNTNKYYKIPVNQSVDKDSLNGLTSNLEKGIKEYIDLPTTAKEVNILREESLTVNGKNYDCTVIRVDLKETNSPMAQHILRGPSIYWVDKASNFILKESSSSTFKKSMMVTKKTTIITSFKINESLPASLFVFTPPPGSKEINIPTGKQ